jgi:catechol-2,3-dioxygenase
MSPSLVRIAHVNVRIPQGSEAQAEAFWCGLLGFAVRPKPPGNEHAGRWFAHDGFEVHVSPDIDFAPATRAHTAFVVDGLTELASRLAEAGVEVRPSKGTTDDLEACFFDDPFGNRFELCIASAA